MAVSVKLPNFTYIDDTERFRWLAVELSSQPLVAIDTESNSLHAYEGVLCLIQISTRDADYIVDPLAITDLSPLKAIMEDPHIEKVMHAAEYDLMLFKRDYDFSIVNLFDTMVAARLIGHKYHGLASMMQEYFDIKLDKHHQRDDWGARPLPADSLKYAQMDTHFLPELRDILEGKIIKMGRLDEAHELFEEAQHVPPAVAAYDPEGYWKLALSNRLKKRETAILREVYLLREEIAAEENVPTFKIVTNKALVNIARDAPANMRQLNDVRAVPGAQVRRYGQRLLAAVDEGMTAPVPEPPPQPKPPPTAVADCYLMLQQWRKHKGNARGVASDLVLPKSIMWQLAYKVPQTLDDLKQIEGLGPQRVQLYGEELIELLAQFDPEEHGKFE